MRPFCTALDRALRRRLAAATLAACLLGALLPDVAGAIRHCRPGGVTVPMLMLLAAMFIGGFETRAADVGRALLRPGLLLAGLGVALVLRAVVLLGAERAAAGCWPDVREARWLVVGLALTAAMPVAGAAQTWGARVGGDASLGLGLVLSTTLLSPLTTPLGLALAEGPESGGPRRILDTLAHSDATCRFMALWVALPCLAGLLARRLTRRPLRGRLRAALLPRLRLAGLLNALALTYLNAAGVAREIELRPEPRLVAVAAGCGALVCAGPFLAGWLAVHRSPTAPAARTTLTLASGLNNTSAAAALAGTQFGGHPAVLLPIFFYGAAQQVLASFLPGLLRTPTITRPTCGDAVMEVPTPRSRRDFTRVS
ncbi:hypothetical protein ACIHEI_12815 [Kitasatospora sp. NPDC051984]|uniref:hypothetical protein n=1 Tax=Kitasatospora sp. NPDC051984 TaxID=3364059 RepID=UPI0037C85FDD